ncbi:MAG TPA: ABC transporter permease [Candidatus Acidoferrales bacterium]
MTKLNQWTRLIGLRLRSLFRRRQADRELDEEIREHLDRLTEDHRARGLDPLQAWEAALREFGNVELAKENCRDARSVNWIQNFIQDVRFGTRMLLKSPGVTAVVVIALALGVGANTAIFSIVDGFLLRPLPVPSPEQITVLAIQQKNAPIGSSGFSYPEFVDFRRQADAFSDVFGLAISSVQLTANDRSEQCFVNYVSNNFFSALAVKPALGRLILASEGETPGEAPIVVLDYSYWQRRFNGDPAVVGQRILVDDKSATIIGVARPRFHGMFPIFEMDVYLPMSAISLEEPVNVFWSNRDRRRILAFGRLKPGISLREAQSSLDVVTARLASQYPAADQWFTVRAIPEKSARPIPYANNSFVAISGLFLVLAVFVLLLACLNVENILLARGSARQREMGTRAALGAGRGRLICQMLTESFLLAVLGGSAGIAIGVAANRWTNSIHLQNIPLQLDATLDWRVLIFAMGSVLFAGIAVGLLPAIRASSADVNIVLHGGAPLSLSDIHRAGLRNFMIVAQVAGSLVLLVTAGLFIRSLQKVQGFDLGFDPDHVLNVTMDPHQLGYDEARTTAFYRQIERRVRELPGVQSASFASYVPMGGFPSKASVAIEGHPAALGEQLPRVLYNSVDPAYFDTMRIALLRGRDFTDSDDASAPHVAIINQTMSNRFWPHENAIGKRFSMDSATGQFAEVVGITNDGKYQTIGEDAQPFFYVPLAQNFVSKRTLHVRTRLTPESMAGTLKDEIARVTPGLPIVNIETMKQLLQGAFGFFAFRLAATLAAALGTIGLILAVVGVYGVVSFAATQRTREIGIRMALGASARDILHLVWLHGVRLVMWGIAIGIAASWALTRAMTHLVAGISTSDPVTYCTVAILLSVVALLACWIPARRATRVDPMVALRYE